MVGSIMFGYTLDDDVNYFASFTNWGFLPAGRVHFAVG